MQLCGIKFILTAMGKKVLLINGQLSQKSLCSSLLNAYQKKRLIWLNKIGKLGNRLK